MIEKAEKQQTLADFLLLAQNVEKELASAVQSIDMVQAKLYIPSTTYKHLKKGAHQSNIFGQTKKFSGVWQISLYIK